MKFLFYPSFLISIPLLPFSYIMYKLVISSERRWMSDLEVGEESETTGPTLWPRSEDGWARSGWRHRRPNGGVREERGDTRWTARIEYGRVRVSDWAPPPASVVAILFILTLGRTHPCRIMTTLLTVLTFIKPIVKQNLLCFN